MNTLDTLIIHNWINNVFREKVLDDDWLVKHLALIKIGLDLGTDPHTMRVVITAAVCDAAGMSVQGN
jgi:hypothetical protein